MHAYSPQFFAEKADILHIGVVLHEQGQEEA